MTLFGQATALVTGMDQLRIYAIYAMHTKYLLAYKMTQAMVRHD